MKIKYRNTLIGLAYGLACPSLLLADSNTIDKVQHPYVQMQEKEISFSSLYQQDGDPKKDDVLKHKLSIGRAFSDNVFVELAVSGQKKWNQTFQVSSYELETKWQIGEQGEYSADYGMLFEYENEHDVDYEKVSATFIAEKEWGKWTGTSNLTGIYEWGRDTVNEFETALALQSRYRYKPELEPGIEFYAGELNKGIGPVLYGTKRLAPGKKLNWEVGVILGLDQDSPDQTYRALLEYEF